MTIYMIKNHFRAEKEKFGTFCIVEYQFSAHYLKPSKLLNLYFHETFLAKNDIPKGDTL